MNGQSTSTEALPSTAAVCVPDGVVSSSSALCWTQSGVSVVVRQVSRGSGYCNEIETAGGLRTHPLDDEVVH